MTTKVQIFDKISNGGLDILHRETCEFGDSVSDPDAILLRSYNLHGVKLDGNLKAIGRAGAGVNNIPVDQCTKNGIVVFNTPGANANAVKELVILALLLASRDILGGIDYVKSLKGKGTDIPELVEKSKSKFKGFELKNKKLGVMGLGAIGVMVANALSSLGMDVIGYDPFITVDRAWGLSRNIKQAQSLNQLLGESDFITMHMPLTEGTRGFFNGDCISKLKRSALVLNFSRPEIVAEDDILQALQAGRFSRYICDFPTENLLLNDRVILIPHLGASTIEAEDNCAVMIVDQVLDFLRKGNIVNSVNFPNCVMECSGDYRLAIINQNIPNMVSQISNVIGTSDLNIVEMLNKSRGDYAYTLVDISGELDTTVVDKLSSIEGIISVRWIG
jgi:D-3-phosphoglycerate dehydrogenase